MDKIVAFHESAFGVTLDLVQGVIDGFVGREVRLSEMGDYFADQEAVSEFLVDADPVIYRVTSVETGAGIGQLHAELGVIFPGKVGSEYHCTKGHFHNWRPAAEVYVGLRGSGFMLLEEESTEYTKMLPLATQSFVYVPGYTAHRTINTGQEPLVYLGVYPAEAGHDYGVIAERNFQYVLVEIKGQSVSMERCQYLNRIESLRS